jgi:hypothetical protein
MTTLRRSVAAGVVLALFVASSSGCMTGGATPTDEDLLADPVLCQDSKEDSPTDMACTADCTRKCGYDMEPANPRATKYCVCEGGVYIECRCPRPDWYEGAPEAPYCDDWTINGSGRTMYINPRECTAPWRQCIARDPVKGFTPRGCVCLDKDPGDGLDLEWECGSTEKWFYPEQSTIP